MSFICLSVHLSGMLFRRYLCYSAMDFLQTFVSSESWDTDELIGFCGQKVKGQGHCVSKYAKNAIFGVCFCDTSGIRRQIFSRLLSLVHLWIKMNWLGFRRSEVNLIQYYITVLNPIHVLLLCCWNLSSCPVWHAFVTFYWIPWRNAWC